VRLRPDTGSEAADAILLAAHSIRISADRALREHGLSLAGYKALRVLDGEDLSMRRLSDALHVSPRTITDLVDGLEGRGLVCRTPHPQDRRVTVIRLTDTGREHLARARDVAAQAREGVLSGLTPEDHDVLVRLLAQVGAPVPAPAA
jgi:DNA-binding MarR family transcriptional regulator